MIQNDRERKLWVENHEPLWQEYRYWKLRNKGGLQAFVRQFRDGIDAVIREQLGESD